MKLILLTLVISLGACEFTTTRKGGGSSDRVALPLNFTTAKDIQNGQALLFSDSDSIVSETGKMVNRFYVGYLGILSGESGIRRISEP